MVQDTVSKKDRRNQRRTVINFVRTSSIFKIFTYRHV